MFVCECGVLIDMLFNNVCENRHEHCVIEMAIGGQFMILCVDDCFLVAKQKADCNKTSAIVFTTDLVSKVVSNDLTSPLALIGTDNKGFRLLPCLFKGNSSSDKSNCIIAI